MGFKPSVKKSIQKKLLKSATILLNPESRDSYIHMIKIRSYCNQLHKAETIQKIQCNHTFPFAIFKILDLEKNQFTMEIDCISGRIKIVSCYTKKSILVINRRQFIGNLWIKDSEVDRDDPEENVLIIEYEAKLGIVEFKFRAYHEFQSQVVNDMLELYACYEDVYITPRKKCYLDNPPEDVICLSELYLAHAQQPRLPTDRNQSFKAHPLSQ